MHLTVLSSGYQIHSTPVLFDLFLFSFFEDNVGLKGQSYIIDCGH
jgi:hypothetical protein